MEKGPTPLRRHSAEGKRLICHGVRTNEGIWDRLAFEFRMPSISWTTALLRQPAFPPGIDMALHVIRQICGAAVAAEAAHYMEYVGGTCS